jgi:hypothetical protein
VTCLGDLDNDGDIEITVGIPGYSRNVGNSRGGGWATLKLNQITGPTDPPTMRPTHSASPTHIPTVSPTHRPSNSYVPSPSPSLPPTLLPTLSAQPTVLPTSHHSSLSPTHMPTHTPTGSHHTSNKSKDSQSGLLMGSTGFTIFVWCMVVLVFWMLTYKACKQLRYQMIEIDALDIPDEPPASTRPRRNQRTPPHPGDVIPSIKFTASKCFAKMDFDREACSICLGDLEDDDQVKEMLCGHCFHTPCLDEWLSRQFVCPLCKRRPTPMSGDGLNHRTYSPQPGSGMEPPRTMRDIRQEHALLAAYLGSGVAAAVLRGPTPTPLHEDYGVSSDSDSMSTHSSDSSEVSSMDEHDQIELGDIELPSRVLPPPPPMSHIPPPPPHAPVLRAPSLAHSHYQSQEDEIDVYSHNLSSDSDDESNVIEGYLVQSAAPMPTANPDSQDDDEEDDDNLSTDLGDGVSEFESHIGTRSYDPDANVASLYHRNGDRYEASL